MKMCTILRLAFAIKHIESYMPLFPPFLKNSYFVAIITEMSLNYNNNNNILEIYLNF